MLFLKKIWHRVLHLFGLNAVKIESWYDSNNVFHTGARCIDCGQLSRSHKSLTQWNDNSINEEDTGISVKEIDRSNKNGESKNKVLWYEIRHDILSVKYKSKGGVFTISSLKGKDLFVLLMRKEEKLEPNLIGSFSSVEEAKERAGEIVRDQKEENRIW